MEEYEEVYFGPSSFDGNEEEVASNFIIEQSDNYQNNLPSSAAENVTIDNTEMPVDQVQTENTDNAINELYHDNAVSHVENEQVIIVKEDGQVVVANKEGNDENMVVGDIVNEQKLEERESTSFNEIHSYNTGIDEGQNNFLDFPANDIEISETTDVIEGGSETGAHLSGETLTFSIQPKSKVTAKVVKAISHETNYVEESTVDKLTCQYCLQSFTKTGNKQRHIRTVHKIKNNQGQNIRCIECDIGYKHISKLREHLQKEHNLNMSEQELHFPNFDAFKRWKCEIERKNLCFYSLRHGSRKTANGPKYFYVCHRSGKYLPKIMGERQRMLRAGGTCKLGIVCTAAIYCHEGPKDVLVKYVPHHYGHGKETTFVQLSPEEQSAIQETVSKGIPFENLVDDIRDCQSQDSFQLLLLKKRDFRWINSAFNAEEYNAGISDAEGVENWVRRCCQMEDSPVLFYRQENIGTTEEELILVIMTEFQKHILLSAEKNVVCLDSLFTRKGLRFYLTVLFVIDEFEIAFPAAYCISNKIHKSVIEQFLLSIRESTGKLSFKHFMSDNEPYLFESWVSVMEDEPRWLWCNWYVDSKLRSQLKVFKGNVARRAEVYKTMRTLLECQNENIFVCMFKNFISNLHDEPVTKDLSKYLNAKFGSNAKMWAACYRRDVNLSTCFHLEVMHRTFRYLCREGRKKRLDKFLFVVMKLVKCKMLDRISNTQEKDQLNLAIDAINMCHSQSLEIPAENMSALSDKIWLIHAPDEEEPVYVTKELEKCPEHCSLRCAECDICVHQYSCSCVHSMIEANLCLHIHAVVWKLLTPHFFLAPSPPHIDDDTLDRSSRSETLLDSNSDLYERILKKTHAVFRNVKASKCDLNKDSLNKIMKRLDECIDICAGKKVEDPVEAPALNPNTSTIYVLNQNLLVQKSSQPFILPNPVPPDLSKSNATFQYVMMLPASCRIPKL